MSYMSLIRSRSSCISYPALSACPQLDAALRSAALKALAAHSKALPVGRSFVETEAAARAPHMSDRAACAAACASCAAAAPGGASGAAGLAQLAAAIVATVAAARLYVTKPQHDRDYIAPDSAPARRAPVACAATASVTLS